MDSRELDCELLDRFVDKLEIRDCWTWTGAKTTAGYGSIRATRKRLTLSAHRVAYTWFVGPIPDGLHIDHLCRNRACCNPSHLEAVTMQENLARGRALVTTCPQGHEKTEANTYRAPDGLNSYCRICHRDNERRYQRIASQRRSVA